MATSGLPHALTTTGFAALALGGLMAVMSLASAELENPAQAANWSMAGFATGLVGALAAVAGAFLGLRKRD